jgi:hypothetical protein
MVKMAVGVVMTLLFKKRLSFLFRTLACHNGKFFVYFILRYVVIAPDIANPFANISLLKFPSTNLYQNLTIMVVIPGLDMERTMNIRHMIFV